MIQRILLNFLRMFRRTQCPQCSAFDGHARGCNCMNRAELFSDYRRVIGQLDEARSQGQQFASIWAGHYEREKAKNKALMHENNKLRHAKYPGK